MLKIRPVLKNLIARNLESVKILPKCYQPINFFMCDFFCYYFAIIATMGFSRPQTPDFQK